MNRQQIHLRLMTEADTSKIVAWRNKEFVRNNFIYQELFTKEGHRTWMREQVEPGHVVQFIIDRTAHTAEYGIFIGEEDALGCGYGSQTAKLALGYAFETLQLQKVFLRFLEGNVGARKSYENAGFRMIENKRDTVFLQQGERQVFFMEIDRENWMKSKEVEESWASMLRNED